MEGVLTSLDQTVSAWARATGVLKFLGSLVLVLRVWPIVSLSGAVLLLVAQSWNIRSGR